MYKQIQAQKQNLIMLNIVLKINIRVLPILENSEEKKKVVMNGGSATMDGR